MGCGSCGGNTPGYQTVWQFVQVGKPIQEFELQADAITAQRDAGGKGRIQKVKQRIR